MKTKSICKECKNRMLVIGKYKNISKCIYHDDILVDFETCTHFKKRIGTNTSKR